MPRREERLLIGCRKCWPCDLSCVGVFPTTYLLAWWSCNQKIQWKLKNLHKLSFHLTDRLHLGNKTTSCAGVECPPRVSLFKALSPSWRVAISLRSGDGRVRHCLSACHKTHHGRDPSLIFAQTSIRRFSASLFAGSIHDARATLWPAS